MAKVTHNGTIAVDLSAEEVRAAIEHAAWCKVVDDDPSIAVKDSNEVVRQHNGSYRVIYTRVPR